MSETLTILSLTALLCGRIFAQSIAAPPLPIPKGAITVTNAQQLSAALAAAQPGQAIALADGNYDVSGVEPLRIRADGVSLIGQSHDPSKVILKGQGFTSANINEEMIKIEARKVTLAHFTVRDVRANGVKIQTGGNDSALIYNLDFIDVCERSLKGPDVPVSHDGTVRYCRFEQVTPITSAIPNLNFNGDYIAGIDMMKVDGWKIQDNRFVNIRGMNGGGRAAIFLWQGCTRMLIERNVITGCDRGIGLGNPAGNTDVTGSTVRNNFVVAGKDIAIEVCNSSGNLIAGNTVYNANPLFARTLSWLNNGAGNYLVDNLVVGGMTILSGAAPDSSHNLLIADLKSVAGWFRDPANGDLHLTPAAKALAGAGLPLTQVPADIDGDARGAKPDIGADEFPGAGAVRKAPRSGFEPPARAPAQCELQICFLGSGGPDFFSAAGRRLGGEGF